MSTKLIKVQNVCELLEKTAPASRADDWDNVGLLCGRRNAIVKKVLLCVDVTTDVINEAIETSCDMIVSHHPFIMEKINRIDDKDVKSNQILSLAENKISVIAAHTNADSVEGGMNDYLANMLGLKDTTATEHSIYLRVGMLTHKMDVKSLVSIVKEKLMLKTAIVCGDLEKVVTRVGIYTGGAFVQELVAAKDIFDVVITGEFNYHKALDLKEEGVSAILCGHFGSELLFTWWFKEILNRELPELEVCISKTQKEPFIYV